MSPLRIVVGADATGFPLKDQLAQMLRADRRVKDVTDIGVFGPSDTKSYSNIGLTAAEAVAEGRTDWALLICGIGIGMAVSANKVSGIRSTVAHDICSVRRPVLSNDCQVLALGAYVVGSELARALVSEWLGLQFDGTSASAREVAVVSRYEAAGA